MKLFNSQQPTSFQVNGKDLCCQVCAHDRFWRREGQLNTTVSAFFNLEWTSASAVCLVCDSCGYIHWFLPR